MAEEKDLPVVITTEYIQKFDPTVAKANQVTEILKQYKTIDDEDDYEMIKESALLPADELLKEIEAVRVEEGKPALELKRSIDAYAKKISDGIKGEVARLKRMMVDFQLDKKKKQQEMLKNPEVAELLPQRTVTRISSNKVEDTKIQLDFEVEDIDKVPVEYMEISRAKVMAALRNGQEIPGIKKVEKAVWSNR